MRFAFIAKHRSVWLVSCLSEALDVSRSGFHAWLHRRPCAQAQFDQQLTAKVRTSFIGSARSYGARRVWRDVLPEGAARGLHKIERLMRANAFRARPRRRGLPKDDGQCSPVVAPNVLDRQFVAERLNQKWIADFTYVWTAEGGLYVATVIDLFSRKVGRLVDEGGDDRAPYHRRVCYGDLATRQAGRATASLGPGQPIYERTVPAADGR
jgi:putative transposase